MREGKIGGSSEFKALLHNSTVPPASLHKRTRAFTGREAVYRMCIVRLSFVL